MDTNVNNMLAPFKELHLILIISVFIYLSSCSSSGSIYEIGIIDADKFIQKKIKLSEFIDSIIYIPLSSEKIFDRVIHSEYSDKNIFISTNEGVLKYNWNGKFAGMIGRRGQGPDEYLTCNSFTLDLKNEYIYIWSRPEIKVYTFNGRFIKTIKTDIEAIKICFLDNKLYLFSLINASPYKTPYLWTVIDLAGNILSQKSNVDIVFMADGVTYNGNMTFRYNGVGYWNHYNDTIYRISPNGAYPIYAWNKGNYRLTPEKNVLENDDSCIVLRTILESNGYLFIHYLQNHEYKICLYDKVKKTHHSMTLSNFENGFINDIDGGLSLLPEQYIKVNDCEYFVQSVYPDEIQYFISNNKYLESFSKVTVNDNQILILAKIKNGNKWLYNR